MYVNVRAIVERVVDGELSIVVQWRTKHGEECWELPGGRLEEYERMLDGLRREVLEETGLRVTEVENAETHLDTNGADSNVEAILPFAVYQTTRGPVDSMGVYFRCRAEGELLAAGDDTADLRWMPVRELARLIAEDPEAFSWVDRSGMLFYIRAIRQEGVLA